MKRRTVKRIENTMLWFNVGSTIVWALLILPTLLWWRESILWIALMSVWANFAAALAGLVGALATREARD